MPKPDWWDGFAKAYPQAPLLARLALDTADGRTEILTNREAAGLQAITETLVDLVERHAAETGTRPM